MDVLARLSEMLAQAAVAFDVPQLMQVVALGRSLDMDTRPLVTSLWTPDTYALVGHIFEERPNGARLRLRLTAAFAARALPMVPPDVAGRHPQLVPGLRWLAAVTERPIHTPPPPDMVEGLWASRREASAGRESLMLRTVPFNMDRCGLMPTVFTACLLQLALHFCDADPVAEAAWVEHQVVDALLEAL